MVKNDAFYSFRLYWNLTEPGNFNESAAQKLSEQEYLIPYLGVKSSFIIPEQKDVAHILYMTKYTVIKLLSTNS